MGMSTQFWLREHSERNCNLRRRPPAILSPGAFLFMQSPGTLYIVSTPIGNLEDITLRALRVLKEVDLVAAEDTRHTLKLLSHFEIRTPLIAYHQHSEAGRTANLVARLREGQSIALVTDAGTPGVSDPRGDLITAAIDAGIPVVPVPGASAVLTGLVASGLPTARFAFEGFLPRTKSSRRTKLAALAAEPRTLVFYEAGNRTAETLTEMAQAFGDDRPCCVGRELTKKHEQFLRGPLRDVLAAFKTGEQRGEVTIVIGGVSSEGEGETTPEEPMSPEDALTSALQAALASGLSERDAVKQVSTDLKLSKRDVYAAMLSMKGGEEE
jgi:16S rRNA (cytidine1402-2'-O)-methyltransferase